MAGSGRSQVSAGILLYRWAGPTLEVLLAHPGGPYWKNQEFGSWSVPKGIAEDGEGLEAVAEREFSEETGFLVSQVAAEPARTPLDLGEVTLKSGKVVRAWAVEGDLDPAHAPFQRDRDRLAAAERADAGDPRGRRGRVVRDRGGDAPRPPGPGGVRRAARGRAAFVTPGS